MSLGTTMFTLWLRDMKRFKRNHGRIIGSMSAPVLFLVVLGTGFGRFFRYKPDVSYMEFLGPGIMGMSLLFSSTYAGMSILWDRQFGFLKEILVAPVSRFGIMAGKTLGSVTTSVCEALIILAALILGRLVRVDALGILLALVFMSLISASFVSLGIALASRMIDPHGFQLVFNFLVMPVFFLSGALFPVEGLPDWLTVLTRVNPLTYGVDGMRFALGGPYQFHPAASLAILIAFLGATTMVGASLFRRMPA